MSFSFLCITNSINDITFIVDFDCFKPLTFKFLHRRKFYVLYKYKSETWKQVRDSWYSIT